MALLIINGPNLNLLGKREKNIYGDTSFEEYLSELRESYPDANLMYFQSLVLLKGGGGSFFTLLFFPTFNHIVRINLYFNRTIFPCGVTTF